MCKCMECLVGNLVVHGWVDSLHCIVFTVFYLSICKSSLVWLGSGWMDGCVGGGRFSETKEGQINGRTMPGRVNLATDRFVDG